MLLPRLIISLHGCCPKGFRAAGPTSQAHVYDDFSAATMFTRLLLLQCAKPGGSPVFVCFPSFLVLTLQEQYVRAGDLNTDVPERLGAESRIVSFFSSNLDPADIELRAFIITCAGFFFSRLLSAERWLCSRVRASCHPRCPLLIAAFLFHV